MTKSGMHDKGAGLHSGLQTFVMTLHGAAVALAAQEHLLAVVWHAASPSGTGDQCLQYAMFDISQQQQVRCTSPMPHLYSGLRHSMHCMQAWP